MTKILFAVMQLGTQISYSQILIKHTRTACLNLENTPPKGVF